MIIKDLNIFLRNNSGNKDKHSLIEGFVVRTKQFDNILKELSISGSDKPEQSYLIIGQRGSGKTTLLYRLKYAIEDSGKLAEMLLPIMLTEEQYSLISLTDLWEKIAEELEDNFNFSNIVDEISSVYHLENSEEKAYNIIDKYLTSKNKKIVVFLENIDVLFKKIGINEQKRLREVLLTSNNLRIIGSATSHFEAITNYDMPFYDFFKVIELKGLTRKECERLLQKIGEQYGKKEEIDTIIRNSPQRIESLRRLTGGIPRTISYLFQIFLDNENGKSLKDLYQLIDTLTFLYKAELDQLSPQQQKIIDVMARNWDAIAAKEIASKTKIESKQISSVLHALEKNQFIETISTKSKNNLYRIRERFLNIWYLMRFGKKQEKENVVWLVRFYDAWCDKTELANHIENHLNNLAEGNYDIAAAIDMGNMFLACENVSTELKHKLYVKTKSVIPRKLIKELRISDAVLYDRINGFVKNKQFELAIEELSLIGARDEKYYTFSSWVYSRMEKFELSEEALLNLFASKPTGPIAFRIAYLNDMHLNNETKAIEYYEIALELKEFASANRLGDIYFSSGQIEKAINFYQISFKHGINEAAIGLSRSYFMQNDLENSLEFGKIAVRKKDYNGYETIGMVLQRQKKYKEAEKYFQKFLSQGHMAAYIHLGINTLLGEKPNHSEAISYFNSAINQELYDAHFYLGKLYLEDLANETEGIKHLKIAVEKKHANAAHTLGHYYQDKGQYKISDSYFIKSVELGRKQSLFCLINAIFNENRKNEKHYALKLWEDNFELLSEFTPVINIEYAMFLLWDNQIDKALKHFLFDFTKLSEILNSDDELSIKLTLSAITNFFILLIAKAQYNAALSLFNINEEAKLKQMIKPVYFALMNFMKDDFPKEYLKAGDELKDTINEILTEIEKVKNNNL